MELKTDDCMGADTVDTYWLEDEVEPASGPLEGTAGH